MIESVIFSGDIRSRLSSVLKENNYSSIALLVDDNTRRDCLPLLKDVIGGIAVINITPGEKHKNLSTCELIWQDFTSLGLDRHSLLINLGGGVIGDMGGFCAATFKRGIKFVNIPTTLLSQVDASIGGKVGIDFQGLKNHIGLFVSPYRVLIDVNFLQTLPLKELRSGFAEVIKHYLIADKDQWNLLQQKSFEEQPWQHHVNESVRIKSSVVERDPHEKGLRKILNFGHTIGHALESFFLDRNAMPVLHGEAIAAGMICELFLSEDLELLGNDPVMKVTDYLKKTFEHLPVKKSDITEIIKIAQQDKKNDKGEMKFSLLKNIGEAAYNINVTPAQAEKALLKYCEL